MRRAPRRPRIYLCAFSSFPPLVFVAQFPASARGFPPLAALHLEQHRRHDDRALDDLLREGRDAGEVEDVGENGEVRRADDGADYAALAAEQAGAADDADRDRLELEADAGDRLADGEPRHE